MSRPTCEDCAQPADYTVIDYGRGYQASPLAPQPYLPICTPCLDQRRADEAGDPWPLWADPKILTDWTKTDPTRKDPTMPDTTSLSDTLAPLVAELTSIAADKADLDAREKDIKAQIRALVPGPDQYDAAGLVLVVASNRRFNEKKALPLIPENVLPLVSYPETRIDKDKLKALLPEVYESAQDVYDDRITVKS